MKVSQVCELAVDSGLLSEADAQRHVDAWQQGQGSPDDGDGFIGLLLREKVVSEFQAEALRAGVGGPYQLGPYRVYDRLTGGRLGTIYRAIHEEFNQPVSLKVFPAALKHDSEGAMRLARETRIAVQVNHPNAVRTFQVGKVGEAIFLAFEDLEGETLEAALDRETRLSVEETCQLLRDAARGLQYLHEKEVILRDIQPANIWVTSDGIAKLMEFGAARDALAELDAPEINELDSEVGGTYLSAELLASYDYMSPEQGADEMNADARSDIYALGCVFFRTLTGEVVFPDANPVRKALRHAREQPRLVSEIDPAIPHAVADIVHTMLAKEPGDRYPTAADVVWALDGVIAEETQREQTSREIDAVFLEWASATPELQRVENVPTVVAEPKFVDFLEWVAGQEQADEQ